MLLTWDLPDSDFDHLRVVRSSLQAGPNPIVVYEGSGARYRDRTVKNGVRYRYVVMTFDAAGNHSAGRAGMANPGALLRPADGARVAVPPAFVWAAVPQATYYNLQLYRGKTKVLSVWPRSHELRLPPSWVYAGRRYRLDPGMYRWYVWPGFGRVSAARYGALLGQRSFRVLSR